MADREFRLPDIGEGIAEGEIVSWMVEVGQQVKEEDPFVEVMTDKATVTITVPWDGVIKELKYAAGDIVPVESVMAVIDVVKKGAASEGTVRKRVPAAPAKKVVEKAVEPVQTSFAKASPGKVLAAPGTRRRAREMGIDLLAVNGTGPRGRITNEDLQLHLQSPFPPVAGTTSGEERIPFRGLRRKIADSMTRSKFTATHFTYVDDMNVTDLVRLRKEAKAAYAERGLNITYLPFIMKAVVEAMRAFPTMNSTLDEEAQEIVVKHYYNFGIATDTEKGLMVPVVKNVDGKSIAQIAHDIQEISRKSREGSLGVEDFQGSTFTLTNAGNIGGLFATPVINFPEVAILGVHAIKKTPVVNEKGDIVAGDVMYLSVSIDHRIVDGATGARWMNIIKDCLENPTRLLLGSI